MKRLLGALFLATIFITTSLHAGKGQLNIVAKTYAIPHIAFDKNKLQEAFGMDVAGEMGRALLGLFMNMPETASIADSATTIVPYEGITIYVDKKKRGISSGSSSMPLTVLLSEGEHLIEVFFPIDEYKYAYGSKKVFVGADTISSVSVSATELMLTKAGEEQVRQAKAEAKAKEERERAEAKAKEEREERERAEAKAKQEAEEAQNKLESISGKYIEYMSKFYRDDAKGVVIDPTFKLMWQDGDKVRITDYKGAKSYCEKLSYAGYSDWRLPTIKELQSIVDDSKHDPALNRAFRYYNADNTYYWSSTIGAKNSSGAWDVYFSDGDTGGYLSTSACVRCVRQMD